MTVIQMINRKSYAFYRMATLPMTLRDSNHLIAVCRIRTPGCGVLSNNVICFHSFAEAGTRLHSRDCNETGKPVSFFRANFVVAAERTTQAMTSLCN